MKKHILDLIVNSSEHPGPGYALLRTTPAQGQLPEIRPGQFVQLLVPDTASVLLRRPISVHFVDYDKNELWFLVHIAGKGTLKLANLHAGDTVNAILPLGNGFSAPSEGGNSPLLVGGGVGTAPLLYLGKQLKDNGITPTFLLGARSAEHLLQLSEFEKYGPVFLTTENGEIGEKGFVTQHSVLSERHFSHIFCCGPKPMMVAVARYAKGANIPCEVSLENMMACGLGACLCCVEDTDLGHVCVCKEGPVFNIEQLKWQI